MPRRWSVRWAQPAEQCSQTLGRGDQVERAGPEPVLRAGQRADRADLHGVAGEVRVERASLASGSIADLLAAATALHQVDELVAGDLVGEPGAALAEHAPLAVEQHLGARSSIGFGYSRLCSWNRVSARPVRHRLVLQRALAALVAHRAVERVVDQQQLHDPLLRLLGDRRGELGPDHHAVGDGLGAGGDRLALALHLDQALPAGAGRGQQRVVAEPRDLDAHLLGDPDQQRALGRGDLDAVDGERDGRRCCLRYVAVISALPPAAWRTASAAVRPSM